MDLNSIRVHIAIELYAKYLMASTDTVNRYIVAKIAVDDADALLLEFFKNKKDEQRKRFS